MVEDDGDFGILPYSPARKLPADVRGVDPRDRDTVLRNTARNFAIMHYYEVTGEFTPGEVQPHLKDKYTIWEAPVKMASKEE
jgi:hypothetical protein